MLNEERRRDMRRKSFVAALVTFAWVASAIPASAQPPENPSRTGQCVSETAKERKGKPEEPGVSFPFECPAPPAFDD